MIEAPMNTTAGQSQPQPVPFAAALRFWLRLGFISFGGPAGQIAIMHRELVEQKRWISEKRFLHALNYCMLLPGPEAQQLATYIGWLLHRTWGGIAAGALFVLPSLLLLIGLSWVYVAFGQVSWVAGLLYGIKPAVAALVLAAVHRMGGKILKTPSQTPILWSVAALSFVAVAYFKVPFPAVVLCAALLGWLAARRWPAQFAASGGHATKALSSGAQVPALIDDDTPTPAHAVFRRSRLGWVLLVGLGLWLLPLFALAVWVVPGAGRSAMSGTPWVALLSAVWVAAPPVGQGGLHLLHMAWFFTKAALLTFGGAYAVLPYVYQGAVEHFAWLTSAQMMDGLALGESTPGPLIIVVAFVGFLGGWGQQVLGPDALFLGAALAAVVVVWFTFLPSFVFILAGGPLVEATHGRLGFTAPLSAITAAVVGVIASLALFFVVSVALLPEGQTNGHPQVDWVGVSILLAALIALIRYKRGVMPVIAACAAAGWLAGLSGFV